MCTHKEKSYYQVLTYDQYSCPVLQSWHHTQEEADQAVKGYNNLWPNSEWWVEEGTEYILDKCRECGDPDAEELFDFYGYSTGHWCSDCHEHHYPYRKDAYFDEEYAGERLEDDY